MNLPPPSKICRKVGDKPVALPLDLAKVRLDLDGDGKASDYETLGVMMAAAWQEHRPFLPADAARCRFRYGRHLLAARLCQFHRGLCTAAAVE